MEFIKKIKMIRTAEDLKIDDFAKICNLSGVGYGGIERGESSMSKKSEDKIMRGISSLGWELLDNGVQRLVSNVTYEGCQGLRNFFDDVYQVSRDVGGNISLFNGSPSKLIYWLGEDWYGAHSKRMMPLADQLDFKVLVKEGDTKFIGKGFAKYRWMPEDIFDDRTLYIYGDRYAFIKFSDDNVEAEVYESKQTANVLRNLVQIAWDNVGQEIP